MDFKIYYFRQKTGENVSNRECLYTIHKFKHKIISNLVAFFMCMNSAVN